MRLFPNLSLEKVNRRIAIGFVLAILLISVGFAISFYSYTRSQQDNERIAHTFRVINTLQDILSLAKDIETGTRGYMVTHNQVFLKPHAVALVQIGPQLTNLRRLVADSPIQTRGIDTLSRLIAAKIDISRKQIQLDTQAPSPLKHEYLLIGMFRMNKIRRQIANMVTIEQALLVQRTGNASQSFKNTLVIIFALSLLTFAVLLISYNLLERELRRRAENEAQLRQYETELQTKIQQLEVSNQELERFAFVASHDMQEPLRKIQTFGDLLNQQYPPQVGNGQLYLSKMLTSADRMSRLIRDLLSFSRLKNQPAAYQRVSLRDTLDRVLLDLELLIKTTNATITAGQLPTLDAVPSQLEQLLANLIGNALKYTKPGVSPIVSITAKRVNGEAYPTLFPDQFYYELCIVDNGIGFNEKYLDRIFDVFQRLHAQAQYEGTGIGLAICKRVVAYHNGYITAHSQEGIGTTFVIMLPEHQVNRAATITEQPEITLN